MDEVVEPFSESDLLESFEFDLILEFSDAFIVLLELVLAFG